jgi:vacuolar-type H+-ATPase subunit H
VTENTQTTVEELREALDVAKEELRELLAEQGHLDDREKEAIEEDHQKRMKAAREGGSIRQALTRRKSKVQEVRDRSEELPYLVWSARVREAELRRDYNEALERELEPQVEPARQAALDHKRDVLDPAEAENKRLHEEASRASMEASSASHQKRDAEHALERLLYAGPEDPLRPETAAG